jgi:hypothetical protein
MLVDNSVRTCAALDTLTRSGWGSFYIQCQTYAQQPTPPITLPLIVMSMWNQGNDLLGQIDEWVVKLTKAGCNVPLVEKAPDSTITLLDKIGVVAGAVGGAALAMGVGYAIYHLSKAVPTR